jgi:CubicO group peptidase (beta-lactamase class C family)
MRSSLFTEMLCDEVSEILRLHQVPGVALAIVREFAVVQSIALGMRNTGTRAPMGSRSIFEAYSLTKPLVAYRALQMSEAGLLDLDAPFEDGLFANTGMRDKRLRLITPRMVLSHISGLSDSDGGAGLSFSPGSNWQYSTQGYEILQHAIDRISRVPFDENMMGNVLRPLSMKASSFVWQDRMAPLMAQGHGTNGESIDDRRLSVPDADSLLTTAGDYALFLASCLRSMHSGSIGVRMGEPQVSLGENQCWGMGWGIEVTPAGSILWHIGGGAGAPFQNFVLGDPPTGNGIVMLTNGVRGGAIFEPVLALIDPRRFSLFAFIKNTFHK